MEMVKHMDLEKLEMLYELLLQASVELPNDRNLIHFIEARRVVADEILQRT